MANNFTVYTQIMYVIFDSNYIVFINYLFI